MKRRGLLAVMLALAGADASGPITLEPGTVTLTIGSRRHFDVMRDAMLLAPQGGSPAVWASSDTAVAQVTPEGDVFAFKGGAARITAHAAGKTATANVLVVPGAAGVWLATAGDTFYTFTLNEVTVGDSPSSAVTGSMTAENPRDSVSRLNVQGSRTYPSVALQFARVGLPDATFAGLFTGDTSLAGTLTGMGPAPRPLTLSRPTCYCPWLFPGPSEDKSAASCAAVVLCASPVAPFGQTGVLDERRHYEETICRYCCRVRRGCLHERASQGRRPRGDYLEANSPTRMWAVLDDGTQLIVDGPRVISDTVFGWAEGEEFSIPVN